VKGFHTHYARSHLGATNYSTGNNGKYHLQKKKASEKQIILQKEYLNAPTKCKKCNSPLPFGKRNQSFCNRSCAVSYTNKEKGSRSVECRKNISWGLTGRKYIEPHMIATTCKECIGEFEYIKTNTSRNKEFCSRSCSSRFFSKKRYKELRASRPALLTYREDCSFKFNLADFPDEFDMSLVEQYGWYKAKNRGDNLTGISRDHIISVRYGFDNNIDPVTIAHPANCQLMQHGKNVSKGTRCDLTIEELFVKIRQWDYKYNT
jgi:hypothetical protein